MKKRHLNPEFDVILVEDVNSVFALGSGDEEPENDDVDHTSQPATSSDFFNTSAPSLYEVTTDEKK